jgi:hypothetical protein
MKTRPGGVLLLAVALAGAPGLAAQGAAARAKQEREIIAVAARLEKEPGYENSKAFHSLPSDVQFEALRRAVGDDLAKVETFIAAGQRKAAKTTKGEKNSGKKAQ